MAMASASSLGFARFSYSLILPAMESTLRWNYQKLGTLNTVNALGYLFGAFTATTYSNRFGAKKTFGASIVLLAVMGLLSGASSNFSILITARTLSGVCGGVTFVVGGSLISASSSHLGHKASATASGIYYAGAGTGIVVSGIALRPLFAHFGQSHWQWGWFIMAFFCFLSAALTIPQTRHLLEPPRRSRKTSLKFPIRGLEPSIITSVLFGAGYISFITFLIAFLTAEGSGSSAIAWFWAMLGISAMITGPIWGRILARLKGGIGLAAVLFVASVGTAFTLLTRNFPILMISALLFGSSIMSVATSYTLLAQRNLEKHVVGSAIGVYTTAIAFGQIIGPISVGAISDTSHGVRLGIIASLIMLLAGTVVSLFQKDQIYRVAPAAEIKN
ncbi:MAG: YbfB/YjiJ family MFS transporter [Actinomycetota bacterium]|nr:MAG: YbfB/YjiJ family MFS transporter [Actinomycetota bacterium]